jgi:HAD superfamily hydrolase (TIGR01549 family)
VFDLEDTLVETPPWSSRQSRLEFRRKTKQKLIDLGVPASVLAGIERATIMRNKASEYVEQKFRKTEAAKLKQEMEKFLSRYELDSARKSKLFADTTPTLKNIRRLGLRMALVTNTSAKAANVILRRHGLGRYFDVIITREDVKKLKPDPEGVLLALKRFRVKTFFSVGDLIYDVLAAKRANAVSILVRRPEQSDSQDLFTALPAELQEITKGIPHEKLDFEPDYIVHSLKEVPAIIQKRMKLRARARAGGDLLETS